MAGANKEHKERRENPRLPANLPCHKNPPPSLCKETCYALWSLLSSLGAECQSALLCLRTHYQTSVCPCLNGQIAMESALSGYSITITLPPAQYAGRGEHVPSLWFLISKPTMSSSKHHAQNTAIPHSYQCALHQTFVCFSDIFDYLNHFSCSYHCSYYLFTNAPAFGHYELSISSMKWIGLLTFG